MRRPALIEEDVGQINTIEGLTEVFESIASTQIAKVKSKVDLSTQFFQLLWKRYTSIRIDPSMRITNRQDETKQDKSVFVVITAAAGLSGDIDQRIIETMAQDLTATTDIVVVGSHGASLLAQRGIKFIRYFEVPESDSYIDVSPVIDAVSDYPKKTVYYAEYMSLGIQDVKTIDLISSIRELSEESGEDIMTAEDTIFEPSLDLIADEMESTMLSLVLSQTILESSLAQAASRFNAMTIAKKRASDMLDDYILELSRAKRALADRRMHEVLVSLREKRRRVTVGGRR